jgi:hypothetical protein
MDKALYKVTDNILHALNYNPYVFGIFCDLAKAIYCVNNNVLLHKVRFYGIKGKAGQSFIYLNDRKQSRNKILKFK